MGLVFISCDSKESTEFEPEPEIKKPKVTTGQITEIDENSAKSICSVTTYGGVEIIDKGICWHTQENPTAEVLYSSKNGSGAGTFTAYCVGLKPTTKYYARAYAKYEMEGQEWMDIVYGEQRTFTTLREVTLPSVNKLNITNITTTAATVSAEITDDGGSPIKERGFSWKKKDSDSYIQIPCGTGLGSFTANLTDLKPATEYEVKAYASNSKYADYTYGTFFTENETFTDSRDGNVYKSVTLGKQVWMAENLAYLPKVSSASSLSSKEPNYFVSGYNGINVTEAKATENYKTYGVLYNWPAAMAGAASSNANPSGVQGICPKGWHLPSDKEWTQLSDHLGGEDVAGGKLKETGTSNWETPNEGATNESRFFALPGGDRYGDGKFRYNGRYGYWWSSTEFYIDAVWFRELNYSHCRLDRHNYSNHYNVKVLGFSVRCVRD